ncbi:hypothetical protein HYALB_00012510 [Hymenoscyphus albidus]|uniref:Enoyl reductase (ER) domain-containing protein n=1 Tax=Hymenoscyphus albidus TaxID=595503 RepID=A0A9N9LKE2_9HELO|nr:hypothetical protein HYALB_00012510 [Hymenoscyphus albidus]
MSLPKIQKSIIQPDKNSAAVILTTDPVPSPSPNTTEHLIRVHATAITNGELLWNKNFPLPASLASQKRLIPCNDVAGTVVLTPSNSPFPAGTEVYARCSYLRTGCAREYSILLTEEMARRPKRMSWAESATVPMSVETAFQALFVHAGFQFREGEGMKGKRVFVTAAAGGVGTWVVRLARWAGAEVVGTCGSRNLESVRGLGVIEVLDYSKTDIQTWAQGEGKKVDLVIDCIGGKALEDSWWAVKDEGRIISIFQSPEDVKPKGLLMEIKNEFFVISSNGEQLKAVTELIDAGFGRTGMDSVFAFDQFQDAFARLASGKASGKVLDLGIS